MAALAASVWIAARVQPPERAQSALRTGRRVGRRKAPWRGARPVVARSSGHPPRASGQVLGLASAPLAHRSHRFRGPGARGRAGHHRTPPATRLPEAPQASSRLPCIHCPCPEVPASIMPIQGPGGNSPTATVHRASLRRSRASDAAASAGHRRIGGTNGASPCAACTRKGRRPSVRNRNPSQRLAAVTEENDDGGP